MSAVVSSSGGNINDLSLSKNIVRRHRNRIREQTAKSVIEQKSEAIHLSEQKNIYCIGMEKYCKA